MGQDGERRKTYSAAVIDGCKRTSTIYVGDYSWEDGYKTEQGEGRSSLFTGSKDIACDRESREDHAKRKGTNNADKEGTTAIVDKYRNLLKKTKEPRVGQIIMSGILPVFGNRIYGYRNSKRMAINGRDDEAALQGRGCVIRGFVGQLCGERRHVRERCHVSSKFYYY